MTNRSVTNTGTGKPVSLEVREKMRFVMSVVMLLVVITLAACAAGGAAETTVESDHDEADYGAALVFVTPERGANYPAPDTGAGAYPVAPVEAEMPTGYPEDTAPVPAEEIDLSDVPETTPGSEPQVMPAPGRPDTTLSPGMARLLVAIIDDLSAQTGIPAQDIRLVAAKPMVWSNGALGCPADGMAYIEVIIEGMVFTLEADGKSYTYHTDSGQNYVLCQDGEPVSSGSVSQ